MPTAICAGGEGIGPDSSRIVAQVLGQHSQQQAQRIAYLVQVRLQRRNSRFGPVENGERLLHIEFGHLTIAIFHVGDLQCALLRDHVLFGQRYAGLQGCAAARRRARPLR